MEKQQQQNMESKDVVAMGEDVNFEMIRFVISDLNALNRVMLLPKSTYLRSLQGRLEWGGALLGDTLDGGRPILDDATMDNHGNFIAVPDPSTLHTYFTKSTTSGHIGQVLGEVYWDINTPVEPCPRHLAKRQISCLETMGYIFKAGLEIECTLLDKETNLPLFPDSLGHLSGPLELLTDWFLKMNQVLSDAMVPVNKMHTEETPGQVEIVTDPVLGIKSADDIIITKELMRAVSTSMGYNISFFTRDFAANYVNQVHWNFSILEKTTGKEMFTDDERISDGRLSAFAKHWIAGMVTHAPALKALSCPTTNCYNNTESDYVYKSYSWGIDTRFAALRIKNKGSVYMENRIPTSFSNPYIVLAATIAAGVDGVVRKLSCPEPCSPDAPDLPKTLQEGIEALKSDKVLVDALGEKFVHWFSCLRQADVDAVQHIDNPDERLKVELTRYARI